MAVNHLTHIHEQVGIGYSSGYKRYALTPKRKKYGQILGRSSSSSKCSAMQALKDPEAQKWLVKGVGKVVQFEVKKLCSDRVNSLQ